MLEHPTLDDSSLQGVLCMSHANQKNKEILGSSRFSLYFCTVNKKLNNLPI